MKRAHGTTLSEAARARARPCPVPPDTLLALLDDADVTAEQLCISTSALASLTADLVARSNESVQRAFAQAASSRSAQLACKTQVLGSVHRLSRKHCKRVVADFEAADVSTEQLRVWAAVALAGTGAVFPDFHCEFAASPLLASPQQVQYHTTAVSYAFALEFTRQLGSVATGDGLRVLSAAGPGLKCFEPHSRNEFSVVLAQADGSAPVWLTTDDIVVVLSPGSTPSAGAMGRAYAAFRSNSEWVRQGSVSVVYGGLSEEEPEAMLRLYVCGVTVEDSAGEGDWCVRVPRKPLAGHVCAALGTHLRTLAVVKGYKFGMAVSADEKWLVVGLNGEGTLCVYSLPGGELVRSFGGEGDGPLQFNSLRRLCFVPNDPSGNLIVVDQSNKRLQEVTLEGVFVRFIGVGEFTDGYPYCVAIRDDVIAVGCYGGIVTGSGRRVLLLEYKTGAVMSQFGELGTAHGQLSHTVGIRFTPDGSHVIVAEWEAQRLSVFTVAGVFVRCVGVGVLRGGDMDVLQSVTGEYVVADYFNNRVCVFSPDGSELRSWVVEGVSDGEFRKPATLAAAGRHLYVMDMWDGRVQVFE